MRRPARLKSRRCSVFVVTSVLPRPIRLIQRASKRAINCTASYAAVGGELAGGEMVQAHRELQIARPTTAPEIEVALDQLLQP